MKFLNEKSSTALILSGFASIIISIILFFWQEINVSIGAPIDKEKFGQFGDFIGGLVGSLWALAGVILFYVALADQRKDLKINQEALQQQIKEFKLQRKELEETRWVLVIQRFENTFFSLLQAQRELLASLETKVIKIKTKTGGSEKSETIEYRRGSRFIAHALYATKLFYEQLPAYRNSKGEDLKNKYIEYLKTKKELSATAIKLIDNLRIDGSETSLYKLAFLRYYMGYYSEIKNYISHLTQILKFVNKTSSVHKGREQEFLVYYELIRAQISYKEKKVVFLALEIEGDDKDIFMNSGILKYDDGTYPKMKDEGF